MALIELLSTPLAPEARAPRAAGAPARPFPPPREEGAASIVLPRPRATRALPFLAQYIAQELIGTDEAAPRWREREAAYRPAATESGALLTIEA